MYVSRGKGKESALALHFTSTGFNERRRRTNYFLCLENDCRVDGVNCVHAGWDG